MESLASPILAAALLSAISFHWLFAGTSIGFICSALFVVSVVLPRSPAKPRAGGIWTKTTRGLRIYLKTPRLKGLLALSLASAAAISMVIVNTVVIVRGGLGFGQREVALTLAAYGSGSMLAAFFIPRLLDKLSDRPLMTIAAAILTTGLAVMAAVTALFGTSEGYWLLLLAGWFVLGIAYSASVTPSGRLLRRSANAEDRPAVFAAQFALSHGCWLITYPLAGQIGAGVGQTAAFAVLALVAGIGTAAALWLWPSHDPELLAHSHDDLPPGHDHLREDHEGGKSKAHVFVIDDFHPDWPSRN